jgi:MFS transporter, DHA1 family, inner membrane transport protein
MVGRHCAADKPPVRSRRFGAMTIPTASRALPLRLPSRLPWALIGAACLGSFAASSSGTTRAPFLLVMAHDLDVSMPLVANLVSMTATAWGIASAAGGYLSDLVGRRVLLVAGMCGLCLAMYAQAEAATFFWVAICATLAGGCAGTFTGVVYAEVASHVVDGQRGRALGWVMSGQSMALVVGMPAAAWIGLAGAFALLATVRRRVVAATASAARRPTLRATLSPRILVLLGTGVAERVCYGLAAVYFATFLQAIYHLSLAAIAVPLAIFAFGNIVGTILGGQLADRLRDRLAIVATAMSLSGLVALGLFMWHPSPHVSVALGFLYVMLNALGRPAYMASLAAVPEQVRGTVLGFNGASASIGWVTAAALGAVMIGATGFEGFGPLATLLAFLGAMGALVSRRLNTS